MDNSDEENNDSDEVYDFTIVQFIKRGRQRKTREVDVVPTKWLEFDKQKGRCITKFPDSSINPEDNVLLHDLVRSLANAPVIWKSFSVNLLGRARTYKEALTKLKRLQVETNVFTESDNSHGKHVKLIENAVKKRRLQDELAQLRAVHPSKINKTGINPSVTVVSKRSTSATLETNQIAPADDEYQANDMLMERDDYHYGNDMLSDIAKCKLTPISSVQASSTSKRNLNCTDSPDSDSLQSEISDNECIAPGKPKSTIDINKIKYARTKDYSMTFEDKNENIKNNVGNVMLEVNVPVINLPHVQCKSEFESFVVAQLAVLNDNLKRVESKQDMLNDCLMDQEANSTLKSNSVDFLKKHHVILPITQQELFIEFNEKMKANEILKIDVCRELNKCIEKNTYSISKSFLAMIRRFMSKAVALRYTASRKSKDKENTKSIFVTKSIIAWKV